MDIVSRQNAVGAVSEIALMLLICVGCNGLSKKQGTDFLKPLASTSSDEAKRNRQPMPSERALCLETAKTVAQQGHANEAIKLYERAEELDPSQNPLDAQLAPLYAHARNFDAAIERYQRLVLHSPKDIELCNNFAWTLMEADRYDEAIQQAQRGLGLDANHKRLSSTLAMIYYRQGDRAGAMKQFEQAQGVNAAHHNLAILDIDAGNIESANQHLRQANHGVKPHQETKAIVAALQQSEIVR